jgi:hypothetical protein
MHRTAPPLLLVLLACNPGDPAGSTASVATGASAPMTTGTTTSGTAESSSSSSDTTATPTSSDSTGPVETCAWHRPEFQDLRFCPAPLELGTEITGKTQYGPVSFKFARFGLMTCALCPHAREPSLVLYNEPWTTDTEKPPGDYLRLAPFTEGRIGFQSMNLANAEITLEFTTIPNEETTSPPLDDAAPPVLLGTMTLKSDGWDLAGNFAATLCTDLDWNPPCE